MKTAVRRVLLMSALMSPSALFALGLGEIKLNSALNQPFDAEIELVSAAQEDLAALRASLASNDTFVRYGLDRPAYLSEFSFQVVRSGGRDVLKVTSPRPVTEPFVTLLVEANWPRGRLLREYTVLLDPPVFAPGPVATEAAVAAPVATAAPRAAARPSEPAPAPAPAEPREARPVRPTAAVAAKAGSTYRVQPNDTLWEIASAAYPGGRSDVNRAMVAIYQSNPQAFGGNINVLRAGSELRMPGSGDVSAVSASAAADEVARQYQAWKSGAAVAPAEGADAGRLRLVTPEQGGTGASTATTPAPAGASSTELQNRVTQLEAELAEARRLLEVRNAELATLQGGVAPAEGAEGAAPAAGEAPAEGAAPATEGAEGAPEAAAPAEAEPAAEPPPEQAKKAEEAQPPREEPAPSLLDRAREYWWVLLGLLVAALGLAAFMRTRRASSAAEEDLEEALGGRRPGDLRARVVTPAPAKEAPIVVEERPAAPVAAPRAGEAVRRPATVEDTLSGEGPVSVESGDPLAEADFHMAYGLYDQAADLVQVASKREPQRRDLKLKLLEIFFVWGNRDRFMELARELGATRGEAPAGEWDKVLIMGRQLAPEDPLFAGAVRSSADTLDMELRSGESALDMDLPDLGTGTDVDINLREPGATLAEGGLDFVLDEPVRGTDVDESLAPTIESPRIKPVPSDEQTAEVPIEDLGLDVAELEDLGDLADLEAELQKKVEAEAGDTVERAALSDDDGAADDLLSSTSIMGGSTLVAALGEPPVGTDGAGATAELPNLGPDAREATGYLEQPDFPTDAESATMSEVGTKLDLARAYVDMGDPEGARSILEEVLKEGNANQRKQAERLLAGLP